jgi:hypothetical protein
MTDEDDVYLGKSVYGDWRALISPGAYELIRRASITPDWIGDKVQVMHLPKYCGVADL